MEDIEKFLLENFNSKMDKDEKIELKLFKLVRTMFIKNPNITSKDIYELSTKLNISQEDLNEYIYSFFSKIIHGIGKHVTVPDSNFDQEQLRIGIEVEKEHTDCPFLQKEIAKDHLAECKTYYTRLVKMEKECKND